MTESIIPRRHGTRKCRRKLIKLYEQKLKGR